MINNILNIKFEMLASKQKQKIRIQNRTRQNENTKIKMKENTFQEMI